MNKKISLFTILLSVFMMIITDITLVKAESEEETRDLHYYQEVLSVDYGEDGLVFDENANSRMGYGPNAFYPVNDNDIYIMDSMVKTVRHYIGGKLADSVKLETDESTGAFTVGEEGIIYAGCSYNGRHYLEVFDKEGKQLSKVNAGSYETRSLKIIGNELILNDDMSILVYDISSTEPKQMDKMKFDCPEVEENVAPYYLLSDTSYDYVETLKTVESTYLTGEFTITAYNKGDGENQILFIPIEKFKYRIDAFFNEDKNENRYMMIPEDDAVKIYMVEFSNESEYVSRFAEYEKQAKEYENKNAKKSSGSNVASITSIGYTRSQVLSRANQISGYQWTLKKANTTPVPSNTTLPDFVQAAVSSGSLENGGTLTIAGIPYCWGGFDSQYTCNTSGYSSFAALIAANKIAGNINSSASSKNMNTCGLDCSGLVSAAYGLSTKKSTSGLATFGTAVTESTMQTMDFLVKSGHHTLLFYNWQDTSHTKMLIIESNNPSNYDDKTLIRIVNKSDYFGNGYSVRTPF